MHVFSSVLHTLAAGSGDLARATCERMPDSLSDAPLNTLADLLKECKLEHLQLGTTLASLDGLHEQGRQPLLQGLLNAGAAKLPERQSLANGLAKAKRAGRVAPTDASAKPIESSSAALPIPTPPPTALPIQPATAMPSSDPNRRLRILCLHSFRTNGKILQTQMAMSQQQPLLSSFADCDFIDAPYECNAEDEKKQYEAVKQFFPCATYGKYREWFNASSIDKGGMGTDYVVYDRFDDAIECVERTLSEANPPYDGLMGFSQGGSLALYISAMQEQRQRQRGDASADLFPPLRFLWIQSARLPRDPRCKGLFDVPLRRPTFVTYTEDDTAVAPHETRELISKLESPTVITRPKGGHVLMNVKQSPENGEALKKFLQAQC